MKKVIIFYLFSIFIIPSIFGQDMIWTTMSGSSYRHVSLNSVKSQIMSVSNQFNFFWYDESTPFFSRAEYRKDIADLNIRLQDNRNRTQAINQIINQNNQILSWLDNNHNFVYALRTEIRSFNIDSYQINIVNGNRVYIINFQSNNPGGNAFSTQRNVDWLNRNLDIMLSGMVSATSPSPNSQSASLGNTFNFRTGYTTTSSPFNSRRDDQVARTFRFEDLNSSWFTQVNLQRERTEAQIRTLLSQIGLNATEISAIFFEFRNSAGYTDVARAVRFNYIDRENYRRFIHIERNW